MKGVVIGALTPPRRRLNAQEVLEAMRGNEQLTTAVYRRSLARPLPADVRALVERARADEQHHLDWIERALARAALVRASRARFLAVARAVLRRGARARRRGASPPSCRGRQRR